MRCKKICDWNWGKPSSSITICSCPKRPKTRLRIILTGRNDIFCGRTNFTSFISIGNHISCHCDCLIKTKYAIATSFHVPWKRLFCSNWARSFWRKLTEFHSYFQSPVYCKNNFKINHTAMNKVLGQWSDPKHWSRMTLSQILSTNLWEVTK